MHPYYKHLILLSSLTIQSAVFAQHEGHDEEEIIDLQQVNTTASPFALRQEDVVVATSSVLETELRRSRLSTLGSSLDGQPGIHSSSYAPGAGRPIIRGFDGDRISVLQNGTEIFDVSYSSADHGVTLEPMMIQKVEIVRGPASLLYGNAAIGGVINVIDKTMPREAIDGVTGEAEFRYGSVSDEKAGGLSVQGGQNGFTWSLNYFKREADDYDIPGYAESEFQRESEEHDHDEHEDEHEDEEHEGDEDHEDEHEDDHGDEHEEEVFGVLENSFAESEMFSVGVGWFSESTAYSISYSQYDSFYGVPGHSHGHEDEHDEHEGEEEGEHEDEEHEEGEHDEDEHGEEAVAIDMENRRTAFRMEWLNLGGVFESAELDASFGDYRHVELEGDEIGTIFERDGFDIRLSGIHRPIEDWSGAVGLDFKDESFSAIGEEAFIPANDKQNFALFLVERKETTWGAIELGGRIENQSFSPDDSSLPDRDETTLNLTTGILRRLEDNTTFAANLSFNQRAPNAAELYAFGPHVGTGSFEIGNLDLDVEQSISLDASWKKSIGNLTGEFTLFYSDFDDYVFLEHMDHEVFEALYPDEDDDGLDILFAEAADAEFYGFELDLRFHIIDTPEQRFHFDLIIDQTRATNKSENTNLPRIPTRRIGGRLGYEEGPWSMGLGARHHAKASHLAPEETPTDSYTLVFADLTYHLDIGDSAVELFAIGRNLSDEEARPHTSFVKDLVPLPGRSVELGARVFF